MLSHISDHSQIDYRTVQYVFNALRSINFFEEFDHPYTNLWTGKDLGNLYVSLRK